MVQNEKELYQTIITKMEEQTEVLKKMLKILEEINNSIERGNNRMIVPF